MIMNVDALPRSFTGSPSAHDIDGALALLRDLGAHRVAHSGRNLLQHCIGVAAILKNWGAPAHVLRAGAFHSIYGTEHFREALLGWDRRDFLARAIGREAERLAHTFCILRRDSLHRAICLGEPIEIETHAGATLRLSLRDACELCLIAWANELEQLPHVAPSADACAAAVSRLGVQVGLLPAAAVHQLHEAYKAAEGRARRATPRRGVGGLFGEANAKKFVRDCWPSAFYMHSGPVERLQGLVDHNLEALCEMRKAFTTAYFRTIDGQSSSVTVTRGQERHLYDAGFTLYFHSLRSRSLDAWIRAMEEDLKLPRGVTRISAFASRRGLGLDPHYDMNDNFVCQARGVKRWRIAPNAHVRYPTVGYTIGRQPGSANVAEAPRGLPPAMPEPFETVELRPGSVMFMPRGMWHDTQTVDEESLHFNIQSGLATWKDAVEFVLYGSTALHLEELRAPILELFEGDQLRPAFEAELKDKLRVLVDTLCAGVLRIDKRELERFVARKRNSV